MILLGALIIIAFIMLMQITIIDYLYGYNQTMYCHNHYGNGTVVCHQMPMNMNMTMPVSGEIIK
jgi:hypothetical protein